MIGPDVGNVGEVRETGNPMFDPATPGDLERALAELAELDRPGLGRRRNCQWDQAARAAIEAIERVRADASCTPAVP